MGFFRTSAIVAVLLLAALARSAGASDTPDAPNTIEAVFSEDQTNQYVLAVEAAMARAQAAHGAIPQAAAEMITQRAHIRYADRAEIERERKLVKHRMVALINVWRRALDPEVRQYVHYGATTVDIYDTAMVLQLRRSTLLILDALRDIETVLIELARTHRNTIMAGRTLGQHALPITFGKKVSTWIGQNRRDIERLKFVLGQIERSAILKGAVGTYAGLGNNAIEIERTFAHELGLSKPYPDDWHGSRDVFAAYAQTLALVTKHYGAIGQELFLLQMTDIGETTETREATSVSSSSMAQKVNPSKSEALIHAARTIPRLAEVVLDDVVNFFERDSTAELNEVIKQLSLLTGANLRTARSLLANLQVHDQAMLQNLNRTHGFIMAQRVAFALAASMGKDAADAHLHDIIHGAVQRRQDFRSALLADPTVSKLLSASEIDTLLDPRGYLGMAGEEIDNVIAHSEAMRKTDPQTPSRRLHLPAEGTATGTIP